jgi:hypothetical protein
VEDMPLGCEFVDKPYHLQNVANARDGWIAALLSEIAPRPVHIAPRSPQVPVAGRISAPFLAATRALITKGQYNYR